MTVILWIITGIVYAFLFVVLVIIGRKVAEVITFAVDHHPSDSEWRKMCESPVFPPDDGQETRTPRESGGLEEEIDRLYCLLRPINFELGICHAHIRVCNHYDQLEDTTFDLISEHGLDITIYLEEYDRNVTNRDVVKNRHVLKAIKPTTEHQLLGKHKTTVQIETLCDWLELFTADPGPLGFQALLDSLRERNRTGDRWFLEWSGKYNSAYSRLLTTTTNI